MSDWPEADERAALRQRMMERAREVLKPGRLYYVYTSDSSRGVPLKVISLSEGNETFAPYVSGENQATGKTDHVYLWRITEVKPLTKQMSLFED